MLWIVRRAVSALVTLLTLALAVSSGWVLWSSSGRVHAEQREWVIVLGDKVEPDGLPSHYLTDRLEVALDLLRKGTVRRALVSGNGESTRGDEVTAMRRYLLERGIAPASVVEDRHGLDTYDSCYRAAHLFGVRDAVVVTQDFHLRRAIALCRGHEIDAVGAEASTDAGVYLTVRNWLREIVLSRPKALLDDVLDPGAQFDER